MKQTMATNTNATSPLPVAASNRSNNRLFTSNNCWTFANNFATYNENRNFSNILQICSTDKKHVPWSCSLTIS